LSDFESFSASESVNQGSTAESFRLFQERMKVAAAQMQAIRAGEQKQKKKEDELAKILSEFIKSNQHNSDLLEFIHHITQLLAFNLPAVFILSLILLNFPELQTQTGLKLLTFEEITKAGAIENPTLPDIYMKNQTLPLQIKIAIDAWLHSVAEAAQYSPAKLLTTGQIANQLRPQLVDCAVYSLEYYLNKLEFPADPTMLKNFLTHCLQGIFQDLKHPQLGQGI